MITKNADSGSEQDLTPGISANTNQRFTKSLAPNHPEIIEMTSAFKSEVSPNGIVLEIAEAHTTAKKKSEPTTPS